MIGVTKRQQDALRFISGYQQAKGYSPSRREISEALGLCSKSSAQRLLIGLEDRGAVRLLPFRDRAIEVLAPVAIPRAPDGEPLHFISFEGED